MGWREERIEWGEKETGWRWGRVRQRGEILGLEVERGKNEDTVYCTVSTGEHGYLRMLNKRTSLKQSFTKQYDEH